jgi:hypothetical protein
MAKEKVQKDKQRSIKHTHKTKDRITRTPVKLGGGELRCSGRVGSSCSTSGTHRVNLVTNPSYIITLRLLPVKLIVSNVFRSFGMYIGFYIKTN